MLALSVLTAGVAFAGEAPVRILVVSEFDPAMPAQIGFMSGLRSELEAAAGYHVVVEYLDRFPLETPAQAKTAREWIRARNGDRPSVIVAVGARSVEFLSNPEATPWPEVPVVFGMFVPELARKSVPPGFTGVTQRIAVRETVELARSLFPATRHVALVGGASPLDRGLTEIHRKDLASFTDLDVIELVGLPLRALEERLHGLPDDTIVIISSYLRDGAGQTWTAPDLVARLSTAVPRPIFATHTTALGRGIVGGVLIDWAVAGQRTGQIARLVLAGESPASIPVETSGATAAILDGRQLARFGVPKARVPAGVEVQFREPTMWGRYRWLLIAVVSGLVLQAVLIAGLLVERRRRRSAETRSRENLAVMAHLSRVGAISELAGAFAHELNSPLGAVVNNAQAARRFVLAGPDRAHEVAACLDDIVSDAQRAGEVVRRIRGHLRREDVEPVRVDVSAVIRDAIHLVEMDARDRGVTLSVVVAPGLPPVSGDDVQLVQVVLNLVVNALDALEQMSEERRRVEVTAEPVSDTVQIRVADTGPGIPPAQMEGVFAPFFTTKRAGLGMGLAITRSIVEAHGGSIGASPAPGGGTVFTVLIPSAAGLRDAREATG
jgi:signal transduction histidine kinase